MDIGLFMFAFGMGGVVGGLGCYRIFIRAIKLGTQALVPQSGIGQAIMKHAAEVNCTIVCFWRDGKGGPICERLLDESGECPEHGIRINEKSASFLREVVEQTIP